jgi:glycosyltransferase involved in cell wall biosynthesis
MKTLPVTLITTVLNERRTMDAFLTALSRQSVLPDELVVVDGGSSDGTLQFLQSWKPPANVRLVVQSISGCNISQGRNAAISLASNDLILVTDAGAELCADWVILMGQALLRGSDVVGGFFAPAPGSRFQRALGSAVSPVPGEIDPETFLPSSRSIAFRKEAWARVEGYPEWLDYCEDLVFDLRLKAAGYKIDFIPEAVVYWHARSSPTAFARQYYRYARGDGKADLWRKRHALRYSAYFAGVYAFSHELRGKHGLRGKNGRLTLFTLGAAALYSARSFRRQIARRKGVLKGQVTYSLLLCIPVIVIGDVAKMLGYAVGTAQRLLGDFDWKQGKTTARESDQ